MARPDFGIDGGRLRIQCRDWRVGMAEKRRHLLKGRLGERMVKADRWCLCSRHLTIKLASGESDGMDLIGESLLDHHE